MTDTDDATEQLLICALDLLDAAIPLALDRLRAAAVPLEDQRAFWITWDRLEHQLAGTDYDEALYGYLSEAEPIECNLGDLAAARRRGDRMTE